MLRSVLLRVRVFRLCSAVVWPLALLFVYPLSLLKKKNPGGLFFLFDRYCIGGAQGVFLDILAAVEDSPKQLYFTRRPADSGLKHLFYAVPNTEIREIDFWTCNPLLRFFAVHFYAFYINRHRGARVLGSNSTFFYDLVPFLSRKVRSIDLFHNFQNYGNHGFQFYGLATCRHLDVRVVVDR
ncbi:MAG TPA: hypothetical protein VFX38_08460, partial [Gammaproteobacteria bacterium]|nr:hypothetical protein [Gammaproteobacteria bacterium]